MKHGPDVSVLAALLGDPARAFALVFSVEAAAFVLAAALALRVGRTGADDIKLPAMPAGDAVPAE